MRSLATLLGASALVLSFAACGGGTLTNALCTTVPLSNVQLPQLVYPVPGYKKVPDDAPAMVVAYAGAPQLMQTVTIDSTSLGPAGAAPKVMPTPYVTNPITGGAFYGITLPKLNAHTHYAVAYRYTSSVGLCGQSGTTSAPMGEFTTL